MRKFFLALAALASLALASAPAAATKTFIISGILTWAPGTFGTALSGSNRVLSFSFNALSPTQPILNTFSASINAIPVASTPIANSFSGTGFDLDFGSFTLDFTTGLDWSAVFPPTPFSIGAVASQVNNAGPFSAAEISILSVNTPPVPEPATWALMLVGFGAAGAFARTRSRPSASRLARP